MKYKFFSFRKTSPKKLISRCICNLTYKCPKKLIKDPNKDSDPGPYPKLSDKTDPEPDTDPKKIIPDP
jgi:hypothetical protein